MNISKNCYRGHRFPLEVISHAVWRYHRYTLSLRDIEDEVFISVGGKHQYLWRAVDQDGDVIDILVQSRRNKGAALRFFRKLFRGQASMPWKIITDKLRSYQAALREIAPSLPHIADQYENNRAEVSHQPTKTLAICKEISSIEEPSD